MRQEFSGADHKPVYKFKVLIEDLPKGDVGRPGDEPRTGRKDHHQRVFLRPAPDFRALNSAEEQDLREEGEVTFAAAVAAR